MSANIFVVSTYSPLLLQRLCLQCACMFSYENMNENKPATFTVQNTQFHGLKTLHTVLDVIQNGRGQVKKSRHTSNTSTSCYDNWEYICLNSIVIKVVRSIASVVQTLLLVPHIVLPINLQTFGALLCCGHTISSCGFTLRTCHICQRKLTDSGKIISMSQGK